MCVSLMRKIFIGNIFLLTLEHDHFDRLLEFAAENHFHLEKLHVQSFLDLFPIFQVDTQHALLFIFEWHHSCKVIWDIWIVLFLFLSVSVQKIVRSSILRQYVLGTHKFRDDLLENKSFSYRFLVFRSCCCSGTTRTFLSFRDTKYFKSLYKLLHQNLSQCFSELSFHILYAVYPFSW